MSLAALDGAFAVVGMDELEPEIAFIDELMFAIAEHALPGGRIIAMASDEVRIPDAKAGAFHGKAEAHLLGGRMRGIGRVPSLSLSWQSFDHFCPTHPTYRLMVMGQKVEAAVKRLIRAEGATSVKYFCKPLILKVIQAYSRSILSSKVSRR